MLALAFENNRAFDAVERTTEKTSAYFGDSSSVDSPRTRLGQNAGYTVENKLRVEY